MLDRKQGPLVNPEFWDEPEPIPTPVEATTAPAPSSFYDVDRILTMERYRAIKEAMRRGQR